MNTIYLRTAKSEREGSRLSSEFKRVLSLLDGRSGSDDLAKRAAPSLRNRWGEIISELVKKGYIVSNPEANLEPKARSMPKPGVSASANSQAEQKLRAAEAVIAALETAAAAHKAKSGIETERVIAALEAAAAADKAKSDLEAKAKADTQKKADRAARTAELQTYFASAREKAAVEIKQSEQKAARARAEMQAAATAKEKSDAVAIITAAAKQRERKNARIIAELEAAIHASKTLPDIVEKSRTELKSINEMHMNDIHRLRDLEIENEALKKLLVEAYVEIAALKASSGKLP
ncbi:MAG: hypothetical protein WAW02_12920 [Sideroxyarcus sp.]